MNLIVLDTETSDLDPDKGAKLLELAWIELSHNGQAWEQIASAEQYIEYPESVIINPHAQALHHIRPDMLTKEKGAIPRYTAILTLLTEHIKPDTLMVAHNAAFDSKFLPEITKPWICTFRAAKHIWPGAPAYSNQVLRYWLKVEPKGIEGKYPHQAMYDVATTTGILLKMLEHHSPEQLLNLSRSPAKLRTIGFGKHRGMEFTSIPSDYLRWLRSQSNLDDDHKLTIDSILNP